MHSVLECRAGITETACLNNRNRFYQQTVTEQFLSVIPALELHISGGAIVKSVPCPLHFSDSQFPKVNQRNEPI